MTKQRLSQYIKLKREIAMLDDQIADAGHGDDFVTDYAKDYSGGFPKIITLCGYGTQEVPRLINSRQRRIAECRDIEGFIEDLDDSTLRQILTRRYIEGRGIEETAKLVGYSESQIKRKIRVFFEKMRPYDPIRP